MELCKCMVIATTSKNPRIAKKKNRHSGDSFRNNPERLVLVKVVWEPLAQMPPGILSRSKGFQQDTLENLQLLRSPGSLAQKDKSCFPVGDPVCLSHAQRELGRMWYRCHLLWCVSAFRLPC